MEVLQFIGCLSFLVLGYMILYVLYDIEKREAEERRRKNMKDAKEDGII